MSRFIIFSFFLLFQHSHSYADFSSPTASVVLNLEQLDKKINLGGYWDFYWQTTQSDYTNHHLVNEAQLIPIPGNWTIAGYPDFGYGLYVKKLFIKGATNTKLALYTQCIGNNYNLYVNGNLLSSVGHFDTIPEKVVPNYYPKAVSFISQSDTIDITIEVANYAYREGGVSFNLDIGKVETIATSFHKNLIEDGFMFGALLLMFFYFGSFYLIRGVDKTVMYFSLLCLVSGLRVATTGEFLIRQIDLPISWYWLVKIEFISIMGMAMFGVFYITRLFNNIKYEPITKVFTSISVLMILFVLFTNSYWTSYIILPFRIFALIQLFFLLYVVLRTLVLREHPLAMLASVGYLFVFIFGINDALLAFGLINTAYLLPIGILAYVFIQAIVITRKFSFSFREVEDLSLKLQSVNKNQEEIIQQRTAELANYNTIKDKIFSIISHDLRAPIATLSSVLTLAEEADDRKLTELRSYFKGIKRSVDNLNLTIENLLVWSQNQINGMTINKSVVNINKEIENVMDLYSLVALQKEITLMHQLTEVYFVKVDPAHFNLMLRNIISNSLKFTNLGGSIVLTASHPKPDKVQICITDNGIGIHPEKIDQLFNLKFHSTTYGTMNEKGTGLGLTLCKEYATKNGGEISIESNLGSGTKVCIVLANGIE